MWTEFWGFYGRAADKQTGIRKKGLTLCMSGMRSWYKERMSMSKVRWRFWANVGVSRVAFSPLITKREQTKEEGHVLFTETHFPSSNLEVPNAMSHPNCSEATETF